MLEKFAKFARKIEKLTDFYIIREEKDCLLIAYRTMTHQAIPPNPENIFSANFINVNKKLPVFFMITCDDKSFKNKLIKEFQKRELPILFLREGELNLSKENLMPLLRAFIAKKFHSN